MNQLGTIISAIETLRIQGAQAVAKESLHALRIVLNTSRASSVKSLSHDLEIARKRLIHTRPTEPCMRNALSYVSYGLDTSSMAAFKKSALRRIIDATSHLDDAKKKISEYGSKKIKKGMIVFTHCHSSLVLGILKSAKPRFEVHNTETRPMFQGRITAKELAKAGIPVTHYIDSAARLALKRSDIMLIGADAITTEGKVINKIGSELFAEVAKKHDVPVYVCTDSWKFDAETVFGYEEVIEERSKTEVWKGAPKGIKIDNHAFEKINSDLITGVITELGVYKPEVLVEIIQENYPWMF